MRNKFENVSNNIKRKLFLKVFSYYILKYYSLRVSDNSVSYIYHKFIYCFLNRCIFICSEIFF